MDLSSKSQNNIGVLLISHGSSLPYATSTFTEISKKFQENTEFPVEVGYMKVEKPSISEAIKNLSLNQIDKVIAMPVFLADGIHTNIDIPIMLGLNPKETDPRSPDGTYPKDHYLNQVEDLDFNGEVVLLDSIGPDPLILELIKNRIEEAVNTNNLNPEKTGVILISHGSRLNYNQKFITKLLEMFKEDSNYEATLGFMELTSPSIPTAINQFTKNNNFNHLIAVPVFIAPGVHTTCDIPSILKLSPNNGEKSNSHHKHNHSNHSHGHGHSHGHSHNHYHNHGETEELKFEGDIIYLNPIGADDLLIKILKQRVDEELNQ
ncbi:MAG: sirohydrochlorin nickelochelatase [Methanobrevibacter sp.]|jgi:sirohydrochlorin cobaltochelatase|nr:sirohydrochlorin nickelochelatase [Methanobrevibacter sp.]